MEIEKKEVPETVSLVALGMSKTAFFNECMVSGDKRGMADEVWVINKLGVLIEHDMLFRMDDLVDARNCNRKSFIKKEEEITVHDSYNNFLMSHDKPIVTSTAYPEYPTSLAYPLEGVINTIGYSYFSTTPAYAAAFAAHIGVKKLRIYGCDYIYPTNIYQAEAGKANMEFILGVIMQMGVEVWIPPTSTLLGSNIPVEDKMYGYREVVEVKPDKETGNNWEVSFLDGEREKIENRKALEEQAQLQKLILKYKDKLKKDLIKGEWITHEDINKYKPDAPEKACSCDTHQGDDK